MRLTCGDVTVYGPYASMQGNGVPGNWLTDAIWADYSDFTYVEFPFQTEGGVVADYAEAPLVGAPVADLTVAYLTIRCLNLDPSGSLMRATVIGEDGQSLTTGLFTQPEGTFTVQEALDGIGPFGENIGAANIAQVFNQNAKLRITWAAAGGDWIRVLEAYVDVEVAEEPPVLSITGQEGGTHRRFT